VLNDLDGDGESDPAERLSGFDFAEVVVIANTAPVADPDGPYEGPEGTTIQLDGTASSDPEGNPITWAWDFDGDGTFDDAAGPTPAFAAIDDGVYPVALQVSDSLLAGTASTQVTVHNVPPDLAPIADVFVQAGPAPISAGFTDPGVADTHTATIDWGEGAGPEPATVLQGSGSGTVQGSHVYAGTGVYDVTVTVVDDDGGSDVGTLRVYVGVQPVPPVADAGGPYLLCPQGQPWLLDGSGSVNPDEGRSEAPGLPGDTIQSWEWDLDGDGTTDATGPQPDVTAFFTALGPGNHPVRLRVTDTSGTSYPTVGLCEDDQSLCTGDAQCGGATCLRGDLSGTDTAEARVRAATDPECLEVCDGQDNDGDGLVDEDLGTTTCGTGACEVTVDSCVDGEVQECVPGAPGEESSESATCSDGIDNDCDGATDIGDSGCEPLLVELESFTARSTSRGVLLEWTTTAEIDNVGFWIVTTDAEGRNLRRVTPAMIPARGDELSGASYEYLDRTRQRQGTLHYWLEDIDVHGRVTRHGPVVVSFERPGRDRPSTPVSPPPRR
jgi:PKD repeat protein